MNTRWTLTLAAALATAGAAHAQANLRIGLAEDPDVLDPTLARTFVGRIVFSALCDKLIDIDEKLAMQPQLATSWDWSADNKALVRRWFEEVWNQGRADAVDEMLAAGAVVHGLGGDMHGPDDFKRFHAAYREAFPDVRIQLEDLIAEGDRVAARWSGTATHQGGGLGFPATGRRVRLEGMILAVVERGRIVEGWNSFDQMGMLQQLGIVSPPAPV